MSSERPSKSEPLRYEILGEDNATAYEKLEKYKGEVDWKYLKPHFDTEVLYFIDPELDLVTVGVAFANDSKQEVSAWIKQRDIVKIEPIHTAQWENSEVQFEALVVSPFVLFRPI